MKLSHLVQQANDIYQLGLNDEDKREVQRRLVSAGFEQKIEQPSDAIDAVLQTTDHLRSRSKMATAATRMYSGMKTEVVAEHQDGCPRCQQKMKRVMLVSERTADYCQACAITLPVRV